MNAADPIRFFSASAHLAMSVLISAASASRAARARLGGSVFLEAMGDAAGFARARVSCARAWPATLPPLVAPLADARACASAQRLLLGPRAPPAVYVYDAGVPGAWAASRAAWWLLARGVRARVVDGGWPALLRVRAPLATGEEAGEGAAEDGGGAEEEEEAAAAAAAAAAASARLVVTTADILADVRLPPASRRLQLLDVRTPGEFAGADFRARGNARGGRLPGARLLPHTALFAAAGGGFLPRAALRAAFERVGLDPRRPVVAVCQAGARAGAAYVALRAAGFREAALYEGAMREWLAQPSLPVDSG